MNSASSVRLTRLAAGGGCGCKIAPGVLRGILAQVGRMAAPPELLVDARHADDAAVWKVSPDCAILATADFFPPVVDIPADFGKIAAANALSDIYAMGGLPLFALALAAMPSALDPSHVADILKGGADLCARAGVPVAGGHSIAAAEPIYGLAVVGRAHPDRILANQGARPGDALILGKPLGVGVLAAALQKEALSDSAYSQMLAQTLLLNKAGPELAALSGAHAMTDVTGFGILGHLLEICRASEVSAALEFSAIPLIPAAEDLAKDGVAAGASARNWRDCENSVILPADILEWQKTLLTDPQTSGGLLFSCAPESANSALDILRKHGCENAAKVGTIKKPDAKGVVAEVEI